MGTEMPANGADEKGEGAWGRRKGSIALGKQKEWEYQAPPTQGAGMQGFLQAEVAWSTLKADPEQRRFLFSNIMQLLVPMDPHFPEKIPWERS